MDFGFRGDRMQTLELSPAPDVRETPSAGNRDQRPILVASDGTDQSNAALIAAAAIADPDQAITAIGVVAPFPAVSPELTVATSPELDRDRTDGLRRDLRLQMAKYWPGEERALEIAHGHPPTEIAAAAVQMDARLIIVGIGRHRLVDRVFGSETAVHLLRVARVPILAATPELTRRPHVITVAMDFSETSVRALSECLRLAEDDATIHVVHAVAPEVLSAVWTGWGTDYERDIGAEFDKLLATVTPERGIRIERAIVHGHPAPEILAFASRTGSELVATGSHGHGFVSRVLLGTVATKILRGARCSVLAVPHDSYPTIKRRKSAVTEHRLDLVEWTSKLDEFSNRNRERRCSVEVDDADLGAQAMVNDYSFLGASYDHHDARAHILLGALRREGTYVSRGIGDVRSIDILRDRRGRDTVLRIAHGAGQTLLSFTR
jgi:nucleotide-binding universal stress UspA family protein